MNEDTKINFDNLIVGQLEIKDKWQKVVSEIEKRKALGTAVTLDRIAMAEAKQNIKLAEEAITDLNKQRSEFKDEEKHEQQAATIAEEKQLIDNLIEEHHIGFLVKENKYAYCMGMQESNSTVVNPIFEFVEAAKFGRVLNKMAKRQLKLGSRVLADELADHFQKIKKDFFMTTCSFNRERWGQGKVYNKADIISRFWVLPDWDNMANYNKDFDFLFRCIGGDKKENIEHLEKWVGYKYAHPGRVGNIPSLDIGGYPGGNGKGRFIELLKTIFTSPCVTPAALKELMDGFNGSWEMAVTLYYDEPSTDELPEGKLKSATGSEDIRIERKGIDATVADRNYSIVFLSNNPNGVVKLSGTGSSGEDRRYSVMTTNLVMVDEAVKLGMTLDQAKVYVNNINNLIKDRNEVAKWLAHIMMKHEVMTLEVLHPLHGKDYKARFNDQKTPLDNAFDYMLPVLQTNRILPFEILKACVMTVTGWEKLGDKKLKQDWKRYLEKNKIDAESLEGNARPHVEYHYNKADSTKLQKACYVMTGSSNKAFDMSTVVRKKPFDMKKAKESCEHSDLLVFLET